MSSDKTAPRIAKTQFEGTAAWIKRPEKQRSNIYSFLHWGLSFFLPSALQPTGAHGGMPSLLDEATRLRAFRAASVRVPDVLEVTDKHIVLSDCGPQLLGILRETTDRHSRQKLLEKAMRNLADLHVQGLTHGRPHLKDMTLLEGNIFLLDLEENPLAVMSLGAAQARDVWLLLASSTEFCEVPVKELTALLSMYQSHSKTDINQELQALGRDLRVFRRIIGLVRAQKSSRDVSGAYWATKVLEAL
ncbi:MAG: hypothetical protein JKY94_09835 [Rhodobacteraceae bacterium]|nr:hypothetical protein [Paracoccaceae bacterium]